MKFITTTNYVDANMFRDIMIGKSMTGILNIINNTSFDLYSKKQATVEIGKYGSEFVAARTCTEQIMDIRNTLFHMGVPLQ